MRLGVVADDFTGASDVANTLTRSGARTMLYLGLPQGPAEAGADAAVVALRTRALPAPAAVAQSCAACGWLLENAAEQILFKYCSTFDSTPEGNIGPVAEALIAATGAEFAIVCPAFPSTGRTVYQGHLFVGDRLLSETGMAQHPLTPMTDPDIRRWLARQTRLPVGHVDLATLRSGGLVAALAAAETRGERLIVADALSEDDLVLLGRGAAGHRLVTGASGIAMGLPANFGIGAARRDRPPFAGAGGPALVLSGSCSRATRRQVEVYRRTHPALAVAAEAALDLDAAFPAIWDFVAGHRDAAPLVFSTSEPAALASLQARFGSELLARAFERLFARLARRAIDAGFQRLVVAGGETSGAVAGVLGPVGVLTGPEIARGVPALMLANGPTLALALKSGNFGDDGFLELAVAVLQGDSRAA